jgi:TRAP-type uncharacterized transport system fused permease subunit
MTTALIAFAAMLALTFLRVPIAFAMALVGAVGFAFVRGIDPALALVGQVARDTVMTADLSVVPLFVLMGNFVSQAKLSDGLFAASHAFLGHRRGGLAMATIVACGGFSAICGSSIATAATMSKVAMPSMRKYGYDPGFAAGSIAAGGTLGILIPPSVIFVFYGLMTGTSISKLFAAGILPGILGILLYVAAVKITIILRPGLGPQAERVPWPERWRALSGVLGVIVLFVIVIGGIYLGIFTPTEAAGIGAFGGFLFALGKRSLTFRKLRETHRASGARPGFGPRSDGRDHVHSRDLHRARLRAREHVDDHSHDPRFRARRDRAELRFDLVRRHRRGGHGDRAHHAAGRDERLRIAEHASRFNDGSDISRCHALHFRRHRSAGVAGFRAVDFAFPPGLRSQLTVNRRSLPACGRRDLRRSGR